MKLPLHAEIVGLKGTITSITQDYRYEDEYDQRQTAQGPQTYTVAITTPDGRNIHISGLTDDQIQLIEEEELHVNVEQLTNDPQID